MKGTYLGGQFLTLPLAQPASNEPITRTISRRVAGLLLPHPPFTSHSTATLSPE